MREELVLQLQEKLNIKKESLMDLCEDVVAVRESIEDGNIDRLKRVLEHCRKSAGNVTRQLPENIQDTVLDIFEDIDAIIVLSIIDKDEHSASKALSGLKKHVRQLLIKSSDFRSLVDILATHINNTAA